MGRHSDVRWHAGNQEWRSDCGDLYVDKRGRQRRKTMAMAYPDGRKIPKSDKAAALAALGRRLEAIAPKATDGFSVRQIIELYLYRLEQRVQADQAAPKTYEEYSKLISAIGASFGLSTPADQIRAKDLKAIVDSWKERGKAASTINAMIGAVAACFSWAATPIADRGKDFAGNDLPEQLISANPFLKFPRLPIPQSRVKYADRSEVARLLRWIWNHFHPERIEGPFTVGPTTGLRHGPDRKQRPRDHWNRQFVVLIRTVLWAGCRPSEASRALWEYIDWEAGTITLPPNRWKNGRKTGKSRRIYLTPILLRALRRIHDGPVRHPQHIFAHRNSKGLADSGPTTGLPWHGESLSNRMRVLRDKAIAEGVPLRSKGDNRWHLYRLRHTRASDGLMQGFSEATVAEVLGTSADMIRKTYGHLLDEHTANAARSMARRRG